MKLTAMHRSTIRVESDREEVNKESECLAIDSVLNGDARYLNLGTRASHPAHRSSSR